MLNNLQFRVSEVAYHLERLSHSSASWRAVENKDKGSFRAICKKLHIPKKYVNDLVKIIFSSNDPSQLPWPPW